MTLSVEALLVASLMMAVFAAISAVGSSLFLGAGYERLRSGFENIKKQTAFFSNAIHELDQRVDSVEKQSGYFFETLNQLEQQQKPKTLEEELLEAQQGENLIVTNANEDMAEAGKNLLTKEGFSGQSPTHFH